MAERVFTQTFVVVGAVIEKNGRFLLVKEAGGTDKGKWNFPAGWLDIGESPATGIKREVEEETGHEFIPDAILGIYSLVRKDCLKTLGCIGHPVKIIYLGQIADDIISDLQGDVSEIKWFSPEDIDAMDSKALRDMDIKNEIRDYLAGKKYPLELLTHTVQN